MATNSETCTIQMPYRPTKFCITIMKPFYTEELPKSNKQQRNKNSE